MNNCGQPNRSGFINVVQPAAIRSFPPAPSMYGPSMALIQVMWEARKSGNAMPGVSTTENLSKLEVTEDRSKPIVSENQPRASDDGYGSTRKRFPEISPGVSANVRSGPGVSTIRPASQDPGLSADNVVVIDDDSEDDVIFVGFVEEPKEIVVQVDVHRTLDGEFVGQAGEEPQPRRNPSRKARNSKFFDCDDNIYEKDFNILDTSESESPSDDEPPKLSIPEEKKQSLTIQDLKKWPVDGLHERPEYNSVEKKIEKFDYTIREIQNSAKKPKVEEVKKPKATRKPAAKKYFPRKRNPKRKNIAKVERKVPLHECKMIVNDNYNLLSVFMKNVKAQREMGLHECNVISELQNKENISPENTEKSHEMCVKNYENLLVNQSRLYSLLNQVPFKEAFGNLKHLMD